MLLEKDQQLKGIDRFPGQEAIVIGLEIVDDGRLIFMRAQVGPKTVGENDDGPDEQQNIEEYFDTQERLENDVPDEQNDDDDAEAQLFERLKTVRKRNPRPPPLERVTRDRI